MTMSLSSHEWLRRASVAAAIIMVAGCASTPPQSGARMTGAAAGEIPAPSPAAETPRATPQLAHEADLATRARRAGLTMRVVKGQTKWCWYDKDTGSLIPTVKCVSQDGLADFLELQEERRASLREQPARGGCGGTATGC